MEDLDKKQKNISEYYKDTIGEIKGIEPQKSWEFLKERNKNRLDNTAMSEDDRKVSYGELFDGWDESAKVLSGYDITKQNNSRVLIIMPNLIRMNTLDYGADITGALASFPDPTIDFDKVKKYIDQEGITDIISLDMLYAQNIGNKTEELIKEHGIKNIIVCHDKYFSSLLPNKYKLMGAALNFNNKFAKYITRYEDAVRNTQNTQIKYDSTTGKDIASPSSLSILTHTSGTTTGVGKPIPLTDQNRNSLVNQYELAKFNYQPGMTMLHFIPYFAGYGTVNTVNLGLSQGLELQEVPLFNPNEFGSYLEKYKSNIILATSSCWISMINNPKYANTDLSFLVYASTGGSPLSIEEEIKINSYLKAHHSPVVLTKGYGLSEVGGCAIVTIDGYNKIGSNGVIMPGVNAKLRTEDGKIVDISSEPQTGELLLNSETLTCGVLDGKTIVPTIDINGKPFLETKDIVSIDEIGNVSSVGRKDGMFQRYDCYNVYPLQVENLFKSYDEINECAIIKHQSEKENGVVPKVVIELNPEFKGINIEDLINKIINNSFLSNKHVCSYIANFRDLPHIWDFVNEMPKNTMEKVDLHKLNMDDYDKDRYELDVQEDNMSLKSYTIESPLQKNR